MSETFDELSPDSHGVFTAWTVSGCLVVLILRDAGISAVRWAGTGAAMPGDGVEREVAEVLVWPRVGEKMQLVFGDGGRLTSTEVTKIKRFEPPLSAVARKKQKRENSMSHFDELPGRDVESRAQLYRVVMAGAPLVNALDVLTPEAAARIGLRAEDRDRLSLIFSRALWASTADLHQQGRDEFAAQVTARAKELAEEKGMHP